MQDRVVLLTGGSKGIGKAIALRLAKAGAKVVINYSRDSNAADAVIKELGGPDRALAVQADVSNVSEIERLVDQTVAKFGRIDVVIPNAGMLPMATLEKTSEDLFDRTYALNVKGPFFLAQKAVPHMREGGRIIFVSTGTARASGVMPPYLLYTSTKGAIEQMTRVLSKEMGHRGITVNCVAPGPTATELFYEGKSEQLVNSIKAASPFNCIGVPEDIAELVAFVAGPESRWVSGQIIGANGAAFV